jgi:hypothetical protein
MSAHTVAVAGVLALYVAAFAALVYLARPHLPAEIRHVARAVARFPHGCWYHHRRRHARRTDEAGADTQTFTARIA